MGNQYSFDTGTKPAHKNPQVDLEKLIAIQTSQLQEKYETDCLNVKQLQQVLNIGENAAYRWIDNCSHVRENGRRKMVPIVWIAYYLVTGEMI